MLISTQHNDGIDRDSEIRPRPGRARHPARHPEQFRDDDYEVFVNPTGRFVIGGPVGDASLTGRKIIVDTYGGSARHGGGAFSAGPSGRPLRGLRGALGRQERRRRRRRGACEVQVAYAIGVAHPVSVLIDTFGTATVDPAKLDGAVRQIFDLRPAAIDATSTCVGPAYRATAAYGHFGRTGDRFTWRTPIAWGDLRSRSNWASEHADTHRAGRDLFPPDPPRSAPSVEQPRRSGLVPRRCWSTSPRRAALRLVLVPGALVPVEVGTMVRVPLHGRRVAGWVIDPSSTLRPVGCSRSPKVSGRAPARRRSTSAGGRRRWAGRFPTLMRAASPDRMLGRRPAGPALAPRRRRRRCRRPRGAGERARPGRRDGAARRRSPPIAAAARGGQALVVHPSVVAADRLARSLRSRGAVARWPRTSPPRPGIDGRGRALGGSSLRCRR